jgi:hypothetical protein
MSSNPLDAFDQSASYNEPDPFGSHIRKMESDPEMQLLSKRERSLVIHLQWLQENPGDIVTFIPEKRQSISSIKKCINRIAIKHGFNVEAWEDGVNVSVKLV